MKTITTTIKIQDWCSYWLTLPTYHSTGGGGDKAKRCGYRSNNSSQSLSGVSST